MNKKLDVSQQCVLAAWKTNCILGCINRGGGGSREREEMRPHLECCTQAWGPQLGN